LSKGLCVNHAADHCSGGSTLERKQKSPKHFSKYLRVIYFSLITSFEQSYQRTIERSYMVSNTNPQQATWPRGEE